MENDNENLSSVDSVEQADELLSNIETPETSAIQDAPQQSNDEFDFTVGGKQIKAKREQLIQWAQQGYTAPTRISQLTKELEGFKKKWSEAEPRFNEMDQKYGPVDKYVRENPQFWDHVVKSYEQRNQALQDGSNPIAQVVTDLQKQVQDLVQYKTQIEQQQANIRTQQEDQAYMQTFEGIKKAYADVDFTTPDEEGKTLEYKVLEHATQNGIKDFKTAFRDFYHDELMKRAEGKAKENVIKEKQKNAKLGILGVTQTPTKRTDPKNIRSMSYDDLAQEALRELGIN